MKLTDIGTVKALMGENAFKKQFGQNFLISEAVPRRIAESGAAKGTLEIGPGIGTLTRELCERSEKVVAVEIDTTLLPILDQTLADFQNVKIINQDIMKVDIPTLLAEEFVGFEEIAVCANLPYYITSPVLMKLLESKAPFKSITVMVQKEVAARLSAPAGSETYGALTASVSYYASVKKLFDVPAGCFMPKPKVDSAVVKLSLYEKPPVDCNEATLFKVIRGAFAQRRKTLVNSLSTVISHIPKSTLAEIIVSCGYPATTRGETLDIQALSQIANAIDGYRG
ncbi:MAG: 16S rRNA (adenine(1518)-N(6)/adenine(1519)-N(6))-dimethyltransferase RsmA [Clostridia bacterium]|nr:16S rRNA (adenine(1518)-N(6)/adenine(1519)-N(6))-dimethyltransferase RsmA [Clostridia bacterium]